MQYTNFTFRELVHYLDLTNTDPVVRQLINMIQEGEGSVVAELIEEGMDPADYTFYHDDGKYSAGEYVHRLRNDLECVESDLEKANSELEDVIEERDELKTRSVMDLIEEVRAIKRNSEDLVRDAMKTVQVFKTENDQLREKIDVWRVMES